MSQIKQVKDASDIIQIIGERVPLTKGGANFKAPCPFHSEKTPSFFVSDVMQRYKCFGCGENGDVFTFLQKYEGMSFIESLRYLADRAGITLQDFQPSPEDELRDRLLNILELTKSYYHYLLTDHESGQEARDYLKKRGINNESVKVFQIGFALPNWEGLISYLHDKKKYSLSDIEKAGLIIHGQGGRFYDRFRGRLMFPLTNHRGQVVGFSGRVLDPTIKEAKYINSPETMLYHKSELLFGFSNLYQEIKKANEVVITEGELDCISSTQAHVNNVVAIKGSALTRDQVQLLRRAVNKVLLSLDMDDAGIEATKRAIQIIKEFDLELRVIQIPGGKDPDELAQKEPAKWREAVKSSISVYEFFLQHALTKFNQNEPEGKRQIIDFLAPIFGHITHEVERDFYLKKLAKALEVTDEVVKKDIANFKDKGKLFLPNNESKNKDQNKNEKSRKQRIEEYVLFLLFRNQPPQLLQLGKELQDYQWSVVGANQLIKFLLETEGVFNLAEFTKSLPSDLQQLVSDMYLHAEYSSNFDTLKIESEWKKALTELMDVAVTEEIEQITTELEKLDQKREKSPAEEAAQAELLQRIVALKRKTKA
jgi:DNA primase